MELIKQLNEDLRKSMDSHTFDRLVHFAKEDIEKSVGSDASDVEKIEVILNMIEDVPGHEDAESASNLADRVLRVIKSES